MGERNQYRDKIALRLQKQEVLVEILGFEKIDLAMLSKALDEAKENLVKEIYIQ